MAEKVDLKRRLPHLYAPSAREVTEVDVPPAAYLMVDGAGDPNVSPEFQAAVEALFSLSYALKFAVKKGPLAIDYTVMPLEGLWWADDMANFDVARKSDWKWTLMILQPEWIDAALVADTLLQVRAKKPLPVLERVRFETFAEGRCAQILHVGPFAEEGPTIEKLHRHIAGQGARLVGKHHEIYLSDLRRTAPEKLKTVLRQGMQ